MLHFAFLMMVVYNDDDGPQKDLWSERKYQQLIPTDMELIDFFHYSVQEYNDVIFQMKLENFSLSG